MNILIIRNLIFFVIFVFPNILLSQEINTGIIESLAISTDRTLYVNGDQINFAIVNINAVDASKSISSVVYIELISCQGNSFVTIKLKLLDNKCSGLILIPEELPSGVYFIKAYTKSMRNLDVSRYAFQAIKIVNPLTYKPNFKLDQTENIFGSNELIKDTFLIRTNKSEITVNDSFQIIINPIKIKQKKVKSITVSVIRSLSYQSTIPLSNYNSDKISENVFYPENKGITISGVVTEKKKTYRFQMH